MLLFVASHKGSSPGKQGFKMMVADDGFLFGSIGGGLTEFNMVEKAKDLLQKNAAKPLLIKQVHRTNETNSSGMICAGEQLVVLYPMNPSFITTLDIIIAEKKGILTITQNSFGLNLKGFNNELMVNYFPRKKPFTYSEYWKMWNLGY